MKIETYELEHLQSVLFRQLSPGEIAGKVGLNDVIQLAIDYVSKSVGFAELNDTAIRISSGLDEIIAWLDNIEDEVDSVDYTAADEMEQHQLDMAGALHEISAKLERIGQYAEHIVT